MIHCFDKVLTLPLPMTLALIGFLVSTLVNLIWSPCGWCSARPGKAEEGLARYGAPCEFWPADGRRSN